ncbi:MAG TPA: tripartite tricarboxylate transporter substrate binding protein [Burkholderiales bacterium]|nr:tripartite tricarboxylate transporter substrate binding protein [Burkholderiales bacterium]
MTRALLVLTACLAGVASAQSYPGKPIRMLVSAPAGSGADIVARLVGQKMSEALGQQIVIDNRGGAGGTIATDLTAKASPDGYTVMMVTAGHTINPSVFIKLPYDPVKDLAAVTMLSSTPYLFVAHPSFPAKSVAEVIALAKAKPRQLNYAAGGVAVGSHLAGELFKMRTGTEIVNVPYKGAPQATTDVVAGQVQMAFITMPTALPLVRAGKLRALAVTSAKRVAATPEFPALAETVPNFDVRTWQGLLAPAGTPPAIIARLHETAVKGVTSAEVVTALTAQGYEAVGNSPGEFDKLIRNEIAMWRAVVKAAGIPPM